MGTDVIVDKNGAAAGVRTHFGACFGAKAVVLTTGTFLNGTQGL